MRFANRTEAGRQLARQLSSYSNLPDTIVLGVPRGGVPVAARIAEALHLPLDVFLSRKLGVPGHEELAFGAVVAGDGRYLDPDILRATGLTAGQVEDITQKTLAILEKRAELYREGRSMPDLHNKTVILVDDGIATGASIFAAVRALRQMRPAKLVVAAPVAPQSTCHWLRSQVDELCVLDCPMEFYAVGQFYQEFPQTTDEEVVTLLRRYREPKGSA